MDTANLTGIPTVEPVDANKPVGKKELDRSDFMELFITQLQYQDPMKPMDSYEMAAQMAQFSNMDATMKMSDNMEKLLEYQVSQNNLQLLGLLDTEVKITGNMFGVAGSDVGIPEFVVETPVETCIVEIYNADDTLVKTINVGNIDSGTHQVDWDGTDYNDEKVDDGGYYYKVKALDFLGNPIDVEYSTIGRVSGIDYESGDVLLNINNYVQMPVSEVITVSKNNQ